MNFKTLIEQMAEAFITDTRNDGSEFVKLKDNHAEWMTDVVREVHDGTMPDDEIYHTIKRIINHIRDWDSENVDAARDAIYQLEPYIYTSQLTNWLNQDINNVYYLTEALELNSDQDGFQLLGTAHDLYQREIANRVLYAIEEVLEEMEEDES